MGANYESKVQAQVRICDDQINDLKAKVEEASPEMRKQLEEQINEFILNREALKRGFLEITDQGMCAPVRHHKRESWISRETELMTR